MSRLRVSDLLAGETPSIDTVGQFLRQQRLDAQLTIRQLAARAGVSNPYISQVERGLRKPSAEVLSQLARALHISAETLYVRAGMLEEHGESTGTIDAILADPHLTARQKNALIETYRAFLDSSDDAPDHTTHHGEELS